jgi:hypothetical protein
MLQPPQKTLDDKRTAPEKQTNPERITQVTAHCTMVTAGDAGPRETRGQTAPETGGS